jgi:long-chain acyl-CoA synthetase
MNASLPSVLVSFALPVWSLASPTSYCFSTTALVSLPSTRPRIRNTQRNIFAEFLITDLALAAHSVPSFTIASLSLLSPVLDSHAPSAIVAPAAFLPQLLELLYDSRTQGESHTVIVVGELPSNLKSVPNVKVLKWADVESTGTKSDKVPPSTIGQYDFL